MIFLLNNAFKVVKVATGILCNTAFFLKDVVLQGAINTAAAFIGVLVTQAL